MESGSCRSQRSSQKKVEEPLPIVTWEISLSVCKCLKTDLPRKEAFLPRPMWRGNGLKSNPYNAKVGSGGI